MDNRYETGDTPAPPEPAPRLVALPLPDYGARWTYIILGVTAAIFALSLVLSRSIEPSVYTLYDMGAKYNPNIRNGEWWRLFAPIFLHANFLHLAFNSYALYVLGPVVERRYGAVHFLAIYFVAGFAGSVLSFGLNDNLSIGASGAILGVLGAQVAYFYRQRNILNGMGRAMLQNALINVVIIFGMGLLIANVDNFAHLGGLVAGAALGYVLCPRYRFDPANTGTGLAISDDSKPAVYWPLVALVTAAIVLIFVFFLLNPQMATMFSR